MRGGSRNAIAKNSTEIAMAKTRMYATASMSKKFLKSKFTNILPIKLTQV